MSLSASLVHAEEPPDQFEGGYHVRTVVDRLADVGESDVGEPGSLRSSRSAGRRARPIRSLGNGVHYCLGS